MNYELGGINCPYDCIYKTEQGFCSETCCRMFNPMMSILHNLKDVKGFEYTDKEIKAIMEDKIDDKNN